LYFVSDSPTIDVKEIRSESRKVSSFVKFLFVPGVAVYVHHQITSKEGIQDLTESQTLHYEIELRDL